MNSITYVIYLVLTATMICLFILILVIGCFGSKRRSEQVEPENLGGVVDISEDENMGSESSMEDPSTLRGADFDRWMPVINIVRMKERGEKLFDDTCAICIEGLINDKKMKCRKIFPCQHIFHSVCLLEWLKINESCPNCKECLSRTKLLEKELKLKNKKRLSFGLFGKRNYLSRDVMNRIGGGSSEPQRMGSLDSSTNSFIQNRPNRFPRFSRFQNFAVETNQIVRPDNRRDTRREVGGDGVEDLDSSVVNLNQSVNNGGGDDTLSQSGTGNEESDGSFSS